MQRKRWNVRILKIRTFREKSGLVADEAHGGPVGELPAVSTDCRGFVLDLLRAGLDQSVDEENEAGDGKLPGAHQPDGATKHDGRQKAFLDACHVLYSCEPDEGCVRVSRTYLSHGCSPGFENFGTIATSR